MPGFQHITAVRALLYTTWYRQRCCDKFFWSPEVFMFSCDWACNTSNARTMSARAFSPRPKPSRVLRVRTLGVCG